MGWLYTEAEEGEPDKNKSKQPVRTKTRLHTRTLFKKTKSNTGLEEPSAFKSSNVDEERSGLGGLPPSSHLGNHVREIERQKGAGTISNELTELTS